METTSIPCPKCGQIIINPSLNAQQKYRCGGCGGEFAPAGADAGLDLATGQAAAPLGKEPAAGKYGLLLVVAWVLVAFSVIYSAWTLYMQFFGAKSNPFSGHNDSMPVHIQVALNAVVQISMAALSIAIVACLEKMDASASWLSWRSGALKAPVPEAPGSSLPFILPWTVCGGLFVVAGVALLTQAGNEDMILSMYGLSWLALVGSGAILFLLGLACGELRRFFWRMEQLAKPLPQRTRGADVGLGEPRPRLTTPALASSPDFIKFMAPVLLVMYAVLAYTLVGTSAALGGIPGYIWLILAATLLGIVGGAYSMYRLTLQWREVLWRWESASASVDTSPHKGYGLSAANGLVRACWWVGILFIGVQVITLFAIGGGGGGTVTIMLLSLAVAMALFLAWLATLKRESSRLVDSTSAIGWAPKHASRMRNTAQWIAGLTAVQLVLSMLIIFPMLQMMGIIFAAQMVLLAASAVLPTFWFSFIACDLDQAAANLQTRQTQVEGSPA